MDSVVSQSADSEGTAGVFHETFAAFASLKEMASARKRATLKV
jgi:hypothetical protein